jgi:hypothetical protein
MFPSGILTNPLLFDNAPELSTSTASPHAPVQGIQALGLTVRE